MVWKTPTLAMTLLVTTVLAYCQAENQGKGGYLPLHKDDPMSGTAVELGRH